MLTWGGRSEPVAEVLTLHVFCRELDDAPYERGGERALLDPAD